MSISQNFPDEGPSLNLNFASSRILDPRITFTRTSTGTYLSNNGLVTIAPTDTPRFDHSYDGSNVQSLGLLVEESRTNLITYSHEINNTNFWSGARSYISIDSTISPDGSQNADKLVEDNQTGPHHRYFFLSAVNGTTYTLSAFYKAAERSVMYMQFGNQQTPFPDSGTYGARFNLLTGSIIFQGSNVERASIDLVGNGWYKCSITATAVDTASTQIFIAFLINEDGNNSYTGDNTSGIYIWGAQTEAGSFPTSYIPTSGSTVTRSADNASMTGTNFSSWYNSTEGTLFAAARINALGGSNFPGIAYVDDGTTGNSMGFYINDAVNDVIGAESYISSILQYAFASSSAIVPNQLNKVISAYKVNDFAAAFSMSGTVGTDTSGSVPTVNRLIIGLLRGSNAPLNGTVSQLSYYPVRLSNSQLQNLTK